MTEEEILAISEPTPEELQMLVDKYNKQNPSFKFVLIPEKYLTAPTAIKESGEL